MVLLAQGVVVMRREVGAGAGGASDRRVSALEVRLRLRRRCLGRDPPASRNVLVDFSQHLPFSDLKVR